MIPTDLPEKEQWLLRLGRDHRLAHQFFFRHRHPDETPPFHYEIIDDLHADNPRVVELAFRGAGKSTLAEEAVILGAVYKRFKNQIILGENETRAAERLAAVKHELEYNDTLVAFFGPQVGPVWHETKIELANGVVIQAFGRGQSLRGVKHHDTRPDACLIDDLEDEDAVRSVEARQATETYLLRTIIPALASPFSPIRILANMLDPDCLAARLEKKGTWLVRKYPWEYLDADGNRKPTWPAKFPLPHIDYTRREFATSGMLNEYMQEYMVTPMDPTSRAFRSDMFIVEPRMRTFEPVYAMYDPARTVKKTSAHTGKVVFSWVGTKLVVWEAQGELWMPDQIISDMFAVQETYSPVEIGIERNGLEEFIMQPLRAETIRRRQIVPVSPMSAPAGKLAFIRSLQPFFSSRDVIFAKELLVLQQQLLSFPTGRIDVPNALAYALRMRPGLPLYDNFSRSSVVEDLPILHSAPLYLAIGATPAYTTGALCQLSNDVLRVVADWIQEGDPGTALSDILAAARLVSGGKVQLFAGPQHWATYDTIGLQGAAKRAVVRLTMGGATMAGREELRRRCNLLAHGQPALQVSTQAKWTLNAFFGGFAREIRKGVVPDDTPKDGPYRVLMEGLESFVAVIAGPLSRDGDDEPNYAYDARGRRYLSALARHH